MSGNSGENNNGEFHAHRKSSSPRAGLPYLLGTPLFLNQLKYLQLLQLLHKVGVEQDGKNTF